MMNIDPGILTSCGMKLLLFYRSLMGSARKNILLFLRERIKKDGRPFESQAFFLCGTEHDLIHSGHKMDVLLSPSAPLLQVNMASDATVEPCQLLTFILFSGIMFTHRVRREM